MNDIVARFRDKLRFYNKIIFSYLGYRDIRGARLGIDNFRGDEIFLCSYPKSGNTWVRIMISALIEGTPERLTHERIRQLVPDIYQDMPLIKSSKLQPKIIKTHSCDFHNFPRTIYVIRDPRSAWISFYHYTKAYNPDYGGSFLEFLHDREQFEWCGPWEQHAKQAHDEQARVGPDKLLIVRYEDLHQDAVSELNKISRFIGLDAGAELITEIVEKTSFKEMKKSETDLDGGFLARTGKSFFREGAANVYANTFPSELLKTKEFETVRETMQLYGYLPSDNT